MCLHASKLVTSFGLNNDVSNYLLTYLVTYSFYGTGYSLNS